MKTMEPRSLWKCSLIGDQICKLLQARLYMQEHRDAAYLELMPFGRE
jgi:hypothetical protein